MVVPDNCPLREIRPGEVFEILMEDCDLHTVLRCPRGTFTPYSRRNQDQRDLLYEGAVRRSASGSMTPARIRPKSRRNSDLLQLSTFPNSNVASGMIRMVGRQETRATHLRAVGARSPLPMCKTTTSSSTHSNGFGKPTRMTVTTGLNPKSSSLRLQRGSSSRLTTWRTCKHCWNKQRSADEPHGCAGTDR